MKTFQFERKMCEKCVNFAKKPPVNQFFTHFINHRDKKYIYY